MVHLCWGCTFPGKHTNPFSLPLCLWARQSGKTKADIWDLLVSPVNTPLYLAVAARLTGCCIFFVLNASSEVALLKRSRSGGTATSGEVGMFTGKTKCHKPVLAPPPKWPKKPHFCRLLRSSSLCFWLSMKSTKLFFFLTRRWFSLLYSLPVRLRHREYNRVLFNICLTQ